MCLGRTKTFQDSFIRGLLDKDGIHASPEALQETKGLQGIYDQKIRKLNQLGENFLKISYLNIRSFLELGKHGLKRMMR